MRIVSLDLEMTPACNLRCCYCYCKQGCVHDLGMISEATLDAVLEMLGKYARVKPLGENAKAAEVHFYGGEPLLAFERIKYFNEEQKKRGWELRLLAVTNGTIASPEIVEYFEKHNIAVQRSLDGGPESMRICRGEGTLEKYNEATKLWRDYTKSRRSTVVPQTAKNLYEDMQYFRKLGFWQGTSPIPDYYSTWTDQDIEDFKESLWKLGDDWIRQFKLGRPYYCFWFAREAEKFGMMGRTRKWKQGCSAGNGLYCVSWDGNVFMCHRFASEERTSDFCMGTVREVVDGTGKGFGPLVTDCLKAVNEDKWMLRCDKCVGQYHCQVCCYHCNYKCTGKMNEPPAMFCELKREVAKVVNYMDVHLRGIDPHWWVKAIRPDRRKRVEKRLADQEAENKKVRDLWAKKSKQPAKAKPQQAQPSLEQLTRQVSQIQSQLKRLADGQNGAQVE